MEKAMIRELHRKRADADALQERMAADAMSKLDDDAEKAAKRQKCRCLWQEKLNFTTKADISVGKMGCSTTEVATDKTIVEIDLNTLVAGDGIPVELKNDVQKAIDSTGDSGS
jgi:hypothetical protein